ncbi:hypothetical protein BJX96DRAFT_52156 [Aspergillus floccosus]
MTSMLPPQCNPVSERQQHTLSPTTAQTTTEHLTSHRNHGVMPICLSTKASIFYPVSSPSLLLQTAPDTGAQRDRMLHICTDSLSHPWTWISGAGHNARRRPTSQEHRKDAAIYEVLIGRVCDIKRFRADEHVLRRFSHEGKSIQKLQLEDIRVDLVIVGSYTRVAKNVAATGTPMLPFQVVDNIGH